MGIPPSPPKLKMDGSDMLVPVMSSITKVSLGNANATEGTETTILLHQIENSNEETVDAYKQTVEFTDETASTEDVVLREYVLVGGTLGLYRSSKLYTAEPTGAEAPVLGAMVMADRASWDPASKGSGGAYLVWYDGDSWVAIDAQAD